MPLLLVEKDHPVATGVRGSAEGARIALRACRLTGLVSQDSDEIRFQARRGNPLWRVLGSLPGLALLYTLYQQVGPQGVDLSSEAHLMWLGLSLSASVLGASLPASYRVSGDSAAGRIRIRVQGRGLLSRPQKLSGRLEAYLAASPEAK